MEYKSEKEFLDEVENVLKKNGCEIWREEIPDACKNWEKPYRVDLIFYRKDIGFIGIEGKNTRTMRQGGVIADAVNQINNKYRNQTYFNGTVISNWCILVPQNSSWCDNKINNAIVSEVTCFLQNFLGKLHNISLLEYIPETIWRKARVKISNNTQKSITIGGDYNGE